MPNDAFEIQPIEQPFGVTFPDPGKGIPPIPGSKSLTNRALLLAALADGTSTLSGVLFSDDTRVMINALKALGFELGVDEANHTITVRGRAGKIPNPEAELFVGNSGTSVRFLAAMCCLGGPGSVYELAGIPRMHERPIGELVEPLRELGATIEYLGEDGYPPLRIHGGSLTGSQLTMAPTLSSQYITALLKIGPHMPQGLSINFEGKLTSEPYVRMTLRLMQTFGAEAEDNLKNASATIRPGGYEPTGYAIEPDASSASYFFAAACAVPGSTIRINHLGTQSLQGDVGFVNVLRDMGATVDLADHHATVSLPAASRLSGVDTDLNAIPDAAMTIATLAVLADGPTTIRNVGNWRVKETDRMAAMETELRKVGATVAVDGDDITITPPPGNQITPAAIDTYDDHRMAMAFAVIGLNQPGITINDPDCVNKTFPDFFRYLDYLRQTPQSKP